tara:strand:- start:247 stop:714 length:468 start_codon:yes stop_codon:yes gene_type:complete
MPNGKETLDGKDRDILLWVTAGLSYDARIFAERLGQEIRRLNGSGISEQSIIGTLNEDLRVNGRIFGEFKNSIKRGLVGGINQAFRRTGEVGEKLRWIAVSSNLCSDCASRAGDVDTWDGWMSRGMPGSGWSICKEFCYCQLVPDGMEIDDKLKL